MTDLFTLIKKRYPAPEYAVLAEVRNQTGYNRQTRTADAMAMGLYPSRGLLLHGFEIKTDRRDLLRELKEPDKAEEIARFVDHWWLVVSDDTVAQLIDVPANWGLLVRHPKGDKLVVRKDAPKLQPIDVTRTFLASVMRRVAVPPGDTALGAELAAAREAGRVAGVAQGKADMAREDKAAVYQVDRLGRELEGLRDAVADFERHSGVKLEAWGGQRIGRAVRLVLDGQLDNHRKTLQHLQQQAEHVAVQLRDALANEGKA